MSKKSFTKSLIVVLLSMSARIQTFAIVVHIPSGNGEKDVMVTGMTQIQGDESNMFTMIKKVNEYLWFSLGAVCMVGLVYAGITMITAQGDSAKLSKGTKILIGSLIGILVCILSYAIVRLVVNIL